MTGLWEKRINDVEKGKDNMESFIADIKKQTQNICNSITQTTTEKDVKPFVVQESDYGKCPLCGGNVIKTKWGYGCSNYSTTKCSFSISGTICGKKITPTIVKKLLTKGTTGKMDGFKSKAGKPFSMTLKLIDGKTEFEF
jgi:DNA topoisomerase-3